MKKYLLPHGTNAYKANLHAHTNISDGALTSEQVKDLYKSNGYSVVAYTDHDLLIPHDELTDKDFLALPGDGRKRKCIDSKSGEALKEATFALDFDYRYFRITIKDFKGNYAYTNAFFKEDL